MLFASTLIRLADSEPIKPAMSFTMTVPIIRNKSCLAKMIANNIKYFEQIPCDDVMFGHGDTLSKH